MTKESEEGARLREALSQCDVFREDGDDAADVGVATPANPKKGAPPAAQESAASPERSGSIRDALDKLFVGSDSNHVEADEPPRAAAAPAPPAPIPKNTRGTGVDSILERAGYALAETLHFDPQGNDYAAWTRSAGSGFRWERPRAPRSSRASVKAKNRRARISGRSGARSCAARSCAARGSTCFRPRGECATSSAVSPTSPSRHSRRSASIPRWWASSAPSSRSRAAAS